MNWYAYVVNNPLVYVDLTGLFIEDFSAGFEWPTRGIVEEGDNLSVIAQINKIENTDLIYPDQLLELPWIIGNDLDNYRQLLFSDGGVKQTPDLFIAVVGGGVAARKGISYLIGTGTNAVAGLIEQGKSSLQNVYQTVRSWFGINHRVPQFATKPAQHMENPARHVPVQPLRDVIQSTPGVPDPRGSDAPMHYTTIFKNGTMYNLEVLYHRTTNTIYHFQYGREAMGHLPEIVK